MTVLFDFDDTFQLVVFIGAVWLGGKVFTGLRCPSYVGEILVGMLLGPHNSESFVPQKQGLMLAGELGLILYTIELGIFSDLYEMQIVGSRGFFIACFSALVPLILVTGIEWSSKPFEEAAATGFCFVPSCVVVTLNLFRHAKQSNTPIASVVKSAGTYLDVLSLILISNICIIQEDDVWDKISPIVLTIIFLGMFSLLQFIYYSCGVKELLTVDHTNRWLVHLLSLVDEFLLNTKEFGPSFLVLALALCFLPIVHYSKSHFLLGVFFAGFYRQRDLNLHESWTKYVSPIMQLLMKLFFACRIGFVVPVDDMGSNDVWVLMLKFCTAMIAKQISGVVARSPVSGIDFCKIAFSMTIWGEYSFYMAVLAYEASIIGRDTFCALILVFLISSFVWPLALSVVLDSDNAFKQNQVSGLKQENKDNFVYYCIQTKSPGGWRHQDHIYKCITALGYSIVDFRTWHPKGQHRYVMNEFFLLDSSLVLPPKPELPDVDQQELRKTVENLHKELNDALWREKQAQVRVMRWIPSRRWGQPAAVDKDFDDDRSNLVERNTDSYNNHSESQYRDRLRSYYAYHSIMSCHGRADPIEQDLLNIGHLFDGYVHDDYHNVIHIFHMQKMARLNTEEAKEKLKYDHLFGDRANRTHLPFYDKPASYKLGLCHQVWTRQIHAQNRKNVDINAAEIEVDVLYEADSIFALGNDEELKVEEEELYKQATQMMNENTAIIEI